MVFGVAAGPVLASLQPDVLALNELAYFLHLLFESFKARHSTLNVWPGVSIFVSHSAAFVNPSASFRPPTMSPQ